MRKLDKENERERKSRINYLTTKFGKKCWYCGQPLTQAFGIMSGKTDGLHLDHIIPKMKEKNNNNMDNLALSCSACNRAKSNSDVITFLEWLSRIRSSKFQCFILTQLDKSEIDKMSPECWDRLRKDFFEE